MAKFKVKETFSIKSRNYFVISGEIESGEIKKGSFIHIKEDDAIIKLPITSINFLQKRIEGKIKDFVSLCIEINNEKILKYLNKSVHKGETYSVLPYVIDKAAIFSELNRLAVTSFDKYTILRTKLLTNTSLVPGVLYTFRVDDTDDEFTGYYTKKDDKYFKFALIEKHKPISSGSTITQSSALLPHEQE